MHFPWFVDGLGGPSTFARSGEKAKTLVSSLVKNSRDPFKSSVAQLVVDRAMGPFFLGE